MYLLSETNLRIIIYYIYVYILKQLEFAKLFS